MRAVIYARVSSDPKGIGRSTADQVEESKRLCATQGWEVVHILVDNNRSASRYAKADRPAYLQLEQLIGSGHVDVLVTWEASRAQRDLEAYVRLRELCRTSGVLWSYSGRTHDLTRTDDVFTTGLDALLAEREASVTRDRVLRSMRSGAEQGRPHGKVPFGYRRVYDPQSGRLLRQEVDPEEAKAVRMMVDQLLAGVSLLQVTRNLNDRGIPTKTGSKWIPLQVKRTVLSPTRAGKRLHQGQVVRDATWPPIISEEEHLTLTAKLTDPSRRHNKDSQVKYLLSRLALCGVCDQPLYVQKNRGVPSYMCRADGFHVARKVERVDEPVVRLVVARLSQPDAQVSGQDDMLRRRWPNCPTCGRGWTPSTTKLRPATSVRQRWEGSKRNCWPRSARRRSGSSRRQGRRPSQT